MLSIRFSFAWGSEGHQAIAEAAFLRLDAKPKAAVLKILANSSINEVTNIVSAATWPDDIRLSAHPGRFVSTPAAKSFNQRFPGNKAWHFVDYPLDGSYTLNGTYSATNDVVHSLGRCIDVLEGTASAPWNTMKKEEALSWLIHLTGDVHQPLHTAEGFYDFQGLNAVLVTDPATAKGKQEDVGGNDLLFGSRNFHSFWDDTMVTKVGSKEPIVVTAISGLLTTTNYPESGSNHSHWPIEWASDSMQQAKLAYEGITENNVVGQRESQNPEHIDITFSTKDYESAYDDLAKEQLAKAASHLADLLNHINWQ